MSMSKSERKRRAHAERNRKYRQRQKSREAALKAAQAQEWALQRQKEQAAREAEQKETAAADAARIAALPRARCAFSGCSQPSTDNPRSNRLCLEHYLELYRNSAVDPDQPGITREAVRHFNRRRTEQENPFIIRPAPVAAPNTSALLGAILAAPPTADRGYTEYTEGGGTVEHASRADLAAQVQKERDADAGRTWTQNEIVQFEIDVRERMEARTDETTDY
jgi:hypothetical protein